jgi:hypothetical protein
MWAELDTNDQLVAGRPVQVFRKAGAQTLQDGRQLPANWMRLFSTEEKAEMHIFPMAFERNDDPTKQNTGDFTYTFDGTTITETPVVVDMPMVSYKSKKVLELQQLRDAEISTPAILTFGQTDYAFETMGVPRDLMLATRTAVNSGMAFPANFTWSSIDYDDGQGNVYEQTVVSGVTEAQFNQIVQAVIQKEYLAHKKFVELREDVDNATTYAEVDAVTWS